MYINIFYNFNVSYAPTVYNLLQYFPNIKPSFNLNTLYKTVNLILQSDNKEELNFFTYLFKKQVKNIVKLKHIYKHSESLQCA